MKCAGAMAAALATTLLVATQAHADDPPTKVVIAGPKKDPLAARLERELVALGFDAIPIAAIESCAGVAVRAAAEKADASAALCSDGAQVAVWTNDGKDFKLRDVVAPQDKGPRAKEEVAMRAAEVARANLAFREPEPTPAEIAKKPPPPPMTDGWEGFLVESDRPPPPPEERVAPRFAASLGGSYLASTGSAMGNASGQLSAGILPSLSLTARVEIPLSGTPLDAGAGVRIAPGLAGLGVEIPFAKLTSFIVPRLGASAGAAWLHAEKAAGLSVNAFSGLTQNTDAQSSTIFTPAAWLSGAVSLHVYGPARVVVDGLVGSTFGRLAVRDTSGTLVRWGAPLGAVALKAEIALQ